MQGGECFRQSGNNVRKLKKLLTLKIMTMNMERQRELDRAIDHCGLSLEDFENSSKCLRKVMSAIGAKKDEEDYVRERIAVRVRTREVLQKTDSFIDRTNEMLDRFEQDDKKWESIGRSLGLKF